MINVVRYVADRVVSYKENMYGNLPSGIFSDSDHKNFETAHYKYLALNFINWREWLSNLTFLRW